MAAPLMWDTTLLDEATTPPLRVVLGTLLSRADGADVAMAQVRLGHVDLSELELRRVRCRLLLGHLDVATLTALGPSSVDAQRRLQAIARFLDSGRLDIRAAGLLRWKPDFSVFRLPGSDDAVALVGAHYFSDPDVVGGPALTCVLRTRTSVQRVQRRFTELWRHARDVRDVVRAELRNFGV